MVQSGKEDNMNKATALAGVLLSGSVGLGASSATASATGIAGPVDATVSQAAPGSVHTQDGDACTRDHPYWSIPDGGDGTTGRIAWHDYNQGGYDQDNISINDNILDGMSSSVLVTNNYTGKTAYKHVYSGEAWCLDVGNVPNGQTVSWKACGWDNGQVLECRYGTVEE